ncbi:MAG: UDP-glucose 4-epimerase [Mycobacterium sp.]|nr:UDP-glucose 4-epimerase [Mycobacterium sp.]
MTRSPRGGLVVAVTGAASSTGAAVCRALLDTEGIRQVVGLDTVRPPVQGVTWRRADPADPALSASLRRVDALVHLAVDRDPAGDRTSQRTANNRAASIALAAASAAAVRRVVLVTSARVYGAHADNPVPLPEDAPLRAQRENTVLGDLLDIEELAVRSYAGVSVAVLRPALLVGPGVEHAAAGLLDGPRLLAVRGARPHWQFCHVDDLASAIATTLLAGLSGPRTVGAEGWLDQDDVERLLDRRRVELPASVAFGAAARLHAIGVSTPASELSYLVHPWVVGSERLREAGWKPVHSNLEALTAYASGRAAVPRRLRIDAKGATAAAGATVALVGTAALVRRARRRRRGV